MSRRNGKELCRYPSKIGSPLAVLLNCGISLMSNIWATASAARAVDRFDCVCGFGAKMLVRKRSRRSPGAGRARCARALSFSPALQMPAILAPSPPCAARRKKVSCSPVVSREGDCSGLFSHQLWRRGGELFSVSVVRATAFKGSVSGAQVRWFLLEQESNKKAK